jgi:hypothetical protein
VAPSACIHKHISFREAARKVKVAAGAVGGLVDHLERGGVRTDRLKGLRTPGGGPVVGGVQEQVRRQPVVFCLFGHHRDVIVASSS